VLTHPDPSLLVNLVLHPLLITLLISSTLAPRLLAYRAALLPYMQDFARGAPSRAAAPLRKGVAGLGELGWAVVGVWVVWVCVGRAAALAVGVWVVKTSFEGVEKGRAVGEKEGKGKVSARTDVAVRE
jgi:hypothetical protein